MSRARSVIGNWKMNPGSIADAVALARTVAALPRSGLAAVADAIRGTDVAVYAQDVHWEDRGVYTGQLGVSMLRGIATGALVGHSEVRRDQGDDDARVAKKLARVLNAGLRAVLCVGETESQFAAGETELVLERQIERDLADVGAVTADRFVIAYEPVWAIGTGRPATGTHASAAARTIRRALRALGIAADDIRVLYGGSVAATTVTEFASADGIDGALVGGASLKSDELAAIIRAFRS